MRRTSLASVQNCPSCGRPLGRPRPTRRSADSGPSVDTSKLSDAELFKHLNDDREGVTTNEGQLTGSKAGTATEAKGDPYLQSIVDLVGSNWNTPMTIKPSELNSLSADVCLNLGADGTILRTDLVRPSGNSQFDSSLEACLSQIHDLPVPPARWASQAARGKLCPNFSKQP